MNITLTLPGEIRNRIYKELVDENVFLAEPTLQLVNKQLGGEFQGYVLQAIHNKCWKFQDARLFQNILAYAPTHLLAEVTNLHLDFTTLEYYRLWAGMGPLPRFLPFSRLSNLKCLIIRLKSDLAQNSGFPVTAEAWPYEQADYLIAQQFPWWMRPDRLTLIGKLTEDALEWVQRRGYQQRTKGVMQQPPVHCFW